LSVKQLMTQAKQMDTHVLLWCLSELMIENALAKSEVMWHATIPKLFN